jgi:hypothetical protein
VFLWSTFACGPTAVVSGFWSMLLVRIGFGMGEGPNAIYRRTGRRMFSRKVVLVTRRTMNLKAFALRQIIPKA